MQVYEFMALSTDTTTGTLIPSLLYIDVFEITVLPETISRQRFEPPLHADHYQRILEDRDKPQLTFCQMVTGITQFILS